MLNVGQIETQLLILYKQMDNVNKKLHIMRFFGKLLSGLGAINVK